MNIWIGIAGVSVVLLSILLVWLYIFYKKKLTSMENELKLFKKEKEYYSEVMMTLSADYSITFANQAAKELFSLNDNNQVDNKTKRVDLKLGNESPEDFFTRIKTLNGANKESFKIDNATIYFNGKRKKINLYIDKSIYNEKEIITCVIDMENNQVNVKNDDQSKIGYLDVLTHLPSQFAAVSDINSLIMESKNKSESFSIFLLGIDHFNDIQTTLGLSYSNKILKTLAQFFASNQDENITIYRMDADKFLLLVKYPNEETSMNIRARDNVLMYLDGVQNGI